MKSKGFTVIELLVIIAMIGILGAIVYGFFYPGEHQYPVPVQQMSLPSVIDLPPGQTLNRVESIEPFSYTTRKRRSDEPIQEEYYYREPGRGIEITFRER